MSNIKLYDSVSQPKGDFFHKQWAKPIIVLDGESISSDIENIELEVPKNTKLDSIPRLNEEYSFTIELSEEDSGKLRKMEWAHASDEQGME